MIKIKSYSITLAFFEIASLEDYLKNEMKSCLEFFAIDATYSASASGITINCVNDKQAEDIWNTVLIATEDD